MSSQELLEHPVVSQDPKQSPFLWEEWLTAAPAGLILPLSEPRSISLWDCAHPALPRDLHLLLQHTKATQHTALAASVGSCLPSWEARNPPAHRPQLHPQSLKMLKKELFLMKRFSGRAQVPIAGCWQTAGLERESNVLRLFFSRKA